MHSSPARRSSVLQVGDGQADECVEVLRRDRAEVRALAQVDARIGAETLVQLAVADVEGDHARRAALGQAVGEAAGRGSDVEGATARDLDADAAQRTLELLPSAADDAGTRTVTDYRPARGDAVVGLLRRRSGDCDAPGTEPSFRPHARRVRKAVDR